MSGQDSLDNIKLIKFKFDDINVRDIRISSLNNLFVLCRSLLYKSKVTVKEILN